MVTRTQQLAADDKAYVWHPFTQMADYVAGEPLIIERGEGSYLIDTEGRRYLDGVSSLWVTVHGHRKAELDAAIVDQLGRIAHSTLLGIANVPSIELARRLVAVAPPGLTKVFYAENGASAVEIALKMAFQYWQLRGEPGRTRFVSLENAYHGDTLGAVSVGGIDLFHARFRPLLFPTFRAPSPYCYRCPLGATHPDCRLACAEELGRLLAAHRGEVAAVIVEPLVQAAGGMLTQPPGYLRRVRELCDQHDVLLIADEVATGFGRTGRLFACEHEGATPDLLVLGKGITGGYLPLSAVLTTQAIYDAFLGEYAELKHFFHGHTYTGNPLCCAVALANLDLFEREGTLAKLAPKIERLAQGLERFRHLPHVGEVRQRGFMVGIELVAERETRTPYPVAARVGWRVIAAARRRGAVLRPLGDVIVLMPPLSISEAELDELLAITYASIVEVTEGG
ncbi:MAG TPA: adenosylmethionine--8-amino-7-oxononanoate transaminase [Chloroflexota bacterium]|nr:adenosylmethionine--8-amino-7-oxononanoate transaminase [Chloroflexota bacterium]HZU06567.1 adenosylmethionine--8-amino-7-oxononanoate transaminase [Chloroflexota bacterium]